MTQNPEPSRLERIGATRRNVALSAIALAMGATAALAAPVTRANAGAREINVSSYSFADSVGTKAEIERPTAPGGEGFHPCWVHCGSAFGATIIRRSDLLTSNTADLSTKKTADANGRQMGVGGMIVVERMETHASGALMNGVVSF